MIEAPSYLDNPYFHQKIAQLLQQDFIANLTWLDRCFPIAFKGVTEKGDNYPVVYDPVTKLNADIRPDIHVNSYAFFELENPIKYEDDDELQPEDIYDMSATFWFNMLKLDSTKDYDFTSELIRDVTNILKQGDENRSKAEDIEILVKPEDVYEKYNDLHENKTQFLMRPYSYFKIKFSVTTKGRC